jgi:hypothetical protein
MYTARRCVIQIARAATEHMALILSDLLIKHPSLFVWLVADGWCDLF